MTEQRSIASDRAPYNRRNTYYDYVQRTKIKTLDRVPVFMEKDRFVPKYPEISKADAAA